MLCWYKWCVRIISSGRLLKMEVLSAIAAKFLELTVKPIGQHLGCPIFYDRNVKGLKDEFKEFHDERQSVQYLVDAAPRQGEHIEVKVQAGFKAIDEMTEQAEKLYGEESDANTKCSCKSCPRLLLRHQLSRKAKMTQEIVEMKAQGEFDRVPFYKAPELISLSSTSSPIVNEGPMESRNAIMNQILEALADPIINMVGLCGLPGVGKTTLAKDVARKAREHNLFDKVIMVTVSQNSNLKEIQRHIAENVGMKLGVDIVNVRAAHLEKRLKKEKNLLIVLDDLWEGIDLIQLGIPFDYDGTEKHSLSNENGGKNNRCKILLTSRNEELLSYKMNCKINIKLGLLSKKEAWELFKERAELHDDSVPLYLATEVTQQCNGLPLAIVIVAGALRNKKPIEWRDALQRLKMPLLQELDIRRCDELEIFDNEVSSSSTIQEQKAPYSKYPLLLDEKVIPNLEDLTLDGKYAEMMWNSIAINFFLLKFLFHLQR